MITGAHPDLLFQRYFEAALTPYEEQLLSRVLVRGGACADRFVELRELERALAEFFGSQRPVAVGVMTDPSCSRLSGASPDPFRARRFPAGSGLCIEGDCAGEILKSYLRRVRRIDSSSHRHAVAVSMGLLSGEPRDVLHCRHRLGMSCREIAEGLARPVSETEELILRTQRFLAVCVRMRLARTG